MKKPFDVEYVFASPGMPDFDEIFGSWLMRDGRRTFLVDAALATGAADLIAKLKAKGVTRVDYVLISHIHLDHTGALGPILETWPEAKAIVHARGLMHLARPARLWESTVEVMGDYLAAMYGKVKPIARERLIPHTENPVADLTIIETPGHAPHHLSFKIGGRFFVGEAGGCPFRAKGRVYSRPSTPPRYFPAETIGSIDRLLEEPDCPAFFGHCADEFPLRDTLRLYRAQLLFWRDYIEEHGPARPGESFDARLQRLFNGLMERDPNLQPLKDLPADSVWRMPFFVRTSIAGFLQYFAGGETN